MIRYLGTINGTDKAQFKGQGLLLNLLHPLVIFGFFTLLSGISLLWQRGLVDAAPVAEALAMSMILSGAALIFVATVQCRWLMIYHLFALPMIIYVILIIASFISVSYAYLSVVWPLLGFLALGFAGVRSETASHLQITLD